MMQEYIMNFPRQLEEALSIAQTFHLTLDKNTIHNVVITGMGGSGIGGTFAQEYASEYSPLPIVVNKSYHLPKFVNKHSLVIASSYSGNTEETLSCVEDALNSEAKIVAITSGGKLDQLCREKQLPVVRIPKGYPPRTCLGYSFIQVLNILSYFNLVPFSWKKDIESSVQLLNIHQNDIRKQAKLMAQQIYQSFPIIYSLHSEALAIRLRQQFNENSKILCSHHIIPEMNHNELVGWKKLTAQHTVISILTDYDLNQNRKRYLFCKAIFEKNNVPVIELKAKGKSLLEQWMYIVHLSDWISYELSILNNVDAVEVKVIDELKNELSSL